LSNGENATTEKRLSIAFSTDGGASYDTGTNYDEVIAGRARIEDNDVWKTIGQLTTEIKVPNDGLMHTNITGNPLSVKFQIYRPDDAVDTVITYQGSMMSSSGSYLFLGEARHIVSENTDAIRFAWSGGNWSAVGSIQLLGCTQ
jgi:hypothetical protein